MNSYETPEVSKFDRALVIACVVIWVLVINASLEVLAR